MKKFNNQLQCLVWLCAMKTGQPNQLHRHIWNIVINFKGFRISCSVSITLHMYIMCYWRSTLVINALMFHRWLCSTSVTGTSYASGKEFRYEIVTKSYGSTWNKWEKFSSKYFPPLWTDQTYVTVYYDTLLDRLFMFVTYCAQELKCNVRSIPSIMSAFRHDMVSRLVKCCNAFDNELLKSVKQGIAHIPAPAHRTRLPCTLEMIQHIVDQSTQPGASMHQVMLATGAYSTSHSFCACVKVNTSQKQSFRWRTHISLCPTDVQFVLNGPYFKLINSNQIGNNAYGGTCSHDVKIKMGLL